MRKKNPYAYPTHNPSYGAPYGMPQQTPYGQPAYGAPQQPAYGAPQQPPYGAAQQSSYGTLQQPAYGAPPQGAYGQPYGQANVPVPVASSYGNTTPMIPVPNPSAPQFPTRSVPATPAIAGQTALPTQAPQAQALPTASNLLSPQQVQQECQALMKAFKGMGCDKDAVVTIMSNKTSEQCLQLLEGYKQSFGEDLVIRVKGELSGDFKDLVVALLTPIGILDVQVVIDSIVGMGTDEELLIEILGLRSNQHMAALKHFYLQFHKKDMEKDVSSEGMNSTLKKFFIAIMQGARDESGNVSTVDADVESLYKAGEGKWGTDDTAFITILATRSYQALNAIFQTYEKKYGKPFRKVIKDEFSGSTEKVFVAYVDMIQNYPHYLAKRFEKTMAGMGTNEKRLISLVARHRDPTLLSQIKKAYREEYKQTLGKRIKGEVSGHFQKLLIALVGGIDS